jgi:hypothetical protein
MAKPIQPQSLAQSELRRKYIEGNVEYKRQFWTEDIFGEKKWEANSPTASYKKRYVNCFDEHGQLVLVIKEWFRADGSKDILILQLVEETADVIYVYTPTSAEKAEA